MQNGVSTFKYGILNDIVEFDVRIIFDECGEGSVEEVIVDDYDLTEEVGELNLFPKLISYAEEHEEYFTADEVTEAENEQDLEDDR